MSLCQYFVYPFFLLVCSRIVGRKTKNVTFPWPLELAVSPVPRYSPRRGNHSMASRMASERYLHSTKIIIRIWCWSQWSPVLGDLGAVSRVWKEGGTEYRLSPNYFQKLKRMLAPDWAQKMSVLWGSFAPLFCPAFSPDPTDCPWVSEDGEAREVWSLFMQRNFQRMQWIWILHFSSQNVGNSISVPCKKRFLLTWLLTFNNVVRVAC